MGTFYDDLLRFCKMRGTTLYEVSSKTGVALSTLRHYSDGHFPTYEVIAAVCNAFSISPAMLLNEQNYEIFEGVKAKYNVASLRNVANSVSPKMAEAIMNVLYFAEKCGEDVLTAHAKKCRTAGRRRMKKGELEKCGDEFTLAVLNENLAEFCRLLPDADTEA